MAYVVCLLAGLGLGAVGMLLLLQRRLKQITQVSNDLVETLKELAGPITREAPLRSDVH